VGGLPPHTGSFAGCVGVLDGVPGIFDLGCRVIVGVQFLAGGLGGINGL